MPITERTTRLKERCRWKHFISGEFSDPDVRAGIERMRYLTESYKQTQGEPEVIRRAKGLDNVLRKGTVIIQDDELIVGDHAENPNWIPLYPELGYFQLYDFVDSHYTTEEHKEESWEILEWWKQHGLQAKAEPYFTPDELADLYNFTPQEPPTFVNAYTNMTPPYESVLEDGLNKRIEMIEENLNKALAGITPEYGKAWNAKEKLPLIDKIDNWRGMLIAAKAVRAWARRHSRLARIIAENFETNSKRKEELLQISEICWRVPAEPCKGLRDAFQAHFFTFEVCHSLETYSCGYAHKKDTMMWPYYKASVVDKTFQPMTREEAQELMECERLKISEHGVAKGRTYRTAQPGANDLLVETLGGLTAEGEDGCTEFTDVYLDATYSIRTTEPSIGFRWHPKINLETKRRVFKCIASGIGYPSIKHEELNYNQLRRFGATHEQARRWALVLCMSPGVTGKRATQKTRSEGGGSTINISKCLELALKDGYDDLIANAQVGPHTGDPVTFKSYEGVFEALRKQYGYQAYLAGKSKDISRLMETRYLQRPFTSSIDDGCVETGIEAMALQEVPNPWHNFTAAINAVDSLAAIKKLIFEEKKYTMEELVKALRANWEGYEEMRRDFLNVPKFGNDDPYVDLIAKEVYDMLAEECSKHLLWGGAAAMPLGQSVSLFTTLAPLTGALPSGRKHGETLDDGGLSPTLGMDKKGPTAVLKSVANVDHSKHKGLLLNQRLSTDITKSEKGFDFWLAYMNTWYDLNCDHVQFNVVDTKDMRQAQVEPEKYPDLIVRVAGYSARFTNLQKISQDAVIARTEHDLTKAG